MESTEPKSHIDILHKIATIEKEISEIKLSLLKDLASPGKKLVSLKGILKGVDISEQDIQFAKKSLYSNVEL